MQTLKPSKTKKASLRPALGIERGSCFPAPGNLICEPRDQLLVGVLLALLQQPTDCGLDLALDARVGRVAFVAVLDVRGVGVDRRLELVVEALGRLGHQERLHERRLEGRVC